MIRTEIQGDSKNEQGNRFLVYMWEKEMGTAKTTENLMESSEILEQKQYMGDYYLHMGFYVIAMKCFCHVAMSRYIKFGALDNRTMDSFIRLYVAAFAYGNQQMLKEMFDYFEEELRQSDHQELLRGSADGLADKIECLEWVIRISANRQPCDEEI